MIQFENHIAALETKIPNDTLDFIWEIIKYDEHYERTFTIIETYDEFLKELHVNNVEDFIDEYSFESIFSNKPMKHFFLESCDQNGAHYYVIPNNDTMPQELRDYLNKNVDINRHRSSAKQMTEWLSDQSKIFFNKMHDLFTENLEIDPETMKDMLTWYLDWNQERITKRCPECDSIEYEFIHGPEEKYSINITGRKCSNCGKVLE